MHRALLTNAGWVTWGYQDNTNPSLKPTTQVRERKNTAAKEKWSSVKAWGIADTSPTTKHSNKGYFMKGQHSIFLLREKKQPLGFCFGTMKTTPNKKRKLHSQGVDAEASWQVCVSRSLGRSCAFLPDYTNCNNTEGEMMSLLLWKRNMSVFLFL